MKKLLAMLECAVLAGMLVCVSPLVSQQEAEAQWQVPSGCVPVGRGVGTGFLDGCTNNGALSVLLAGPGTNTTPAIRGYPAATFGTGNGIWFPNDACGAAQIGFSTSGAEAVRITSAGYVGIGTRDGADCSLYPGNMLEVMRNQNGATAIIIRNTPTSGPLTNSSANLVFANDSDDQDGIIQLNSSGNSAYAGARSLNFVSNFAGFAFYNGYTTPALALRILNNGRVGIGNLSAPLAPLHAASADATVNNLFAGTTKGIRFGFSGTTSKIEGVDNTGSASFQPLAINGSTLTLQTGATDSIAISASNVISALGTFGVRSSGTGAFDLQFINTENLSANRAITISVNDSARSFTLHGNLSVAGGLSVGNHDVSLSTTGSTSLTLPTSGTLLTNSLTSANFFVGNGSNVATGVAMSGDCSLANTGAVTCSAVTSSTITNDTTTNATMYPVWVTAASGGLPLKVTNSKLFFNPSTGILSATIFDAATGFRVATGAASGNVLRGNGTNFVSAQLAAADLSNGTTGSNAVVLATSPTITTPTISGTVATGGTLTLSASSIITTAGSTDLNLYGGNGNVTFGNGTGAISMFAGGDTHSYFQNTSSGNIYWRTANGGATQFAIIHTASASNYITVTGSNGGNPTLATNSGELAVTPAIIGASYVSVGTKIRAAGSAPAVSSCGTSPTISGSDLAGMVTTGTSTPTSCTITFNAAYSSEPYCVVRGKVQAQVTDYTVSTTAIVVTTTATNNVAIIYHCIARSAGWMLKRDLDPAANDNTPAFMENVA